MNIKKKIIIVLKEETDLPMSQIASAMGMDRESISDDLRQLVVAGIVKQKEDDVDHDWFYRLSDSWSRR